MKKLLIVGIAAAAFSGAPALAADLPTKPVPAPVSVAPEPVFNWTGCYIGANVGWLGGDKKFYSPSDFYGLGANVAFASPSVGGAAYGGQIGCDYQVDPKLVVGIRAMFDGTNSYGSSSLAPAAPAVNDIWAAKINSFGTVVGKAGYLVSPNLEIYGLGGLAFIRDHYSQTDPNGTNGLDSVSQSRTGYDVGVGLSYMVARNLDVWIEYDHMGFGTKTVHFTNYDDVRIKQNMDKVLVGIDYRFDWGKAPVVAKY
jgi:outer membrane immunogenic protein